MKFPGERPWAFVSKDGPQVGRAASFPPGAVSLLRQIKGRLAWLRRRGNALRVPAFSPSPAHRRHLLGRAIALATVLAVVAIATEAARAQSYSVIHNFAGGQDGANPMAGLTMDHAGTLYGTAAFGGNAGGNCGSEGCGTVFRMTNRNGAWLLNPLYRFVGGTDGANPQFADVVIGPDGSLYSTTFRGGNGCGANGCGVVFNLQPPASACHNALCSWAETVLHTFNGTDGAGPVGTLLFDTGGNLYGVTNTGGFRNGGSVYKLTTGGDNLILLYRPYGYPGSSVTSNHAGDLFGSTFVGGTNRGSVYELVPVGSGWLGSDIYDFTLGDDGGYPWSGVVFDAAGNLYGATGTGGAGNGGTAYQLTQSGSQWTLTTLYSFTNPNTGQFVVGPIGNLVLDDAGNLYGTTLVDGAHGYGAVFKLTHVNGGWTYTSLHDFTGGSDGSYPYCNLVFDAQGNLYGTASAGGTNGLGVVFEITGARD